MGTWEFLAEFKWFINAVLILSLLLIIQKLAKLRLADMGRGLFAELKELGKIKYSLGSINIIGAVLSFLTGAGAVVLIYIFHTEKTVLEAQPDADGESHSELYLLLLVTFSYAYALGPIWLVRRVSK